LKQQKLEKKNSAQKNFTMCLVWAFW